MRNRDYTEPAGSIDPVALTLALWLALMVGVGGLVRLSEEASANMTLAEVAGHGQTMESVDMSPFSARSLATGG